MTRDSLPGTTVPTAPTLLPRWITGPMARIYAREIGRRNARFDEGRGVTRLDRPVISVGNLSAGGTGKTPMVRWVVGVLTARGHRPVVAMRGYKAKGAEGSDEQREQRAAMPGVPVVARPDRAAGLVDMFATPEGRAIDRVVLDDGFQHRRLARDVDIVLIDACRPPDRDALLPAGLLREPVGSLQRADAVVITHAEMVGTGDLESLVRRVGQWTRPGTPIGIAEHRWTGLDRHDENSERLETEWLRGRSVVAACGIGRPQGFLTSLDTAGARVVASVVLPDHDPFTERTVARIRELERTHTPEAVVVTPKDWTKLAGRDLGWGAVVVPQLELRFSAGEEAVAEIVRRSGYESQPRA